MNGGAHSATTPTIPVFEGSAAFERLVAGADGSEPGFEAVRQAACLAAPDGWLEVVTAVYLVDANLRGWSAEQIAAQLEQEAGRTARQAKAIAGAQAESQLVNGPPLESLLRELKERHASLAVLGTHGHSRLSEIVIGGVAGELLHTAPCSVLIARASHPRNVPADDRRWRGRVG